MGLKINLKKYEWQTLKLQVNGHEVPLTDPPYVAVYELTSLLEHNCKANCSKSFTDTGGLIIHAAVPIAKGDYIYIL